MRDFRLVHLNRTTYVAAAATIFTACDPGAPLIAASEEPLVITVLALDNAAAGTEQSAVVLSAGTPLQPVYRRIDSFDMRRQRDGARFGWQPIQRSGLPPASFHVLALEESKNVVLPSAASGAALGAADVRAGERYTLELQTEGVTVRGSTILPSSPVPTFDSIGGRRRIVWPKAPAAAGYLISVETDLVPAVPRPVTDTSYTLLENRDPTTRPPTPKATIIALDSNLFLYLSDTTVAAAGLVGSLGIFGGFARTVVPIP